MDAWHGYYNVYFDSQSRQVAFEDLDKRDQQELTRFTKRQSTLAAVASKTGSLVGAEASGKSQPSAVTARSKPFKSSMRPSLRRDCGSERNIKQPTHPEDRSLGSAAMRGQSRVDLHQQTIPSSPKHLLHGDREDLNLTILSRHLSHGSRAEVATGAAVDPHSHGPHCFRTQTPHSPGWTMMTVDKSMMKDISRMVTPFIDELDMNVNAKINGVMRHLSSNIETISSRVDQLAMRVNKFVPPPSSQYEPSSEKPLENKQSATTANIPPQRATQPKHAMSKAFERRPGLAPSILIPTQAVVSQQAKQSVKQQVVKTESTNKYLMQRNQRKMSNMAVQSSNSIPEQKKIDFGAFQVSSGDMKASEIDALQMKRKMSSNRLREKREEVLLKRRKSQGYLSRKNSHITLQDEQQLDRR